MAKKIQTVDPPPETAPEVSEVPDLEDPLISDDPDTNPFEDPFENPPPYTQPEPGEGP